MSRKSFALAILIIFVLVSLVGATGFVLVKHEPNFYKCSALPVGPERKKLADSVDSEIANRLVTGIASEVKWQVNFREDGLNAFLAEGTLSESLWPEGVSDPRISLEDDLIHFGFRYGVGEFSTVISL